MENEEIMAVITELMQDQKEILRSQVETFKAVQELKVKMDAFEREMKTQQSILPSVEIRPFEPAIEKENADLKFLTELIRQKTQPNTMKIFLESDAKKWAVILLLGLTFLTYLFWFGTHK